jgi:hypothetical protein
MDVPDEFLEEITPNACAVFGADVARVLALPLLWAAYERTFTAKGHVIVIMPEQLAMKIKQAWIRSGGLVDVDPIEKIPLTIHQMGDQLILGSLTLPTGQQTAGNNIQPVVGNNNNCDVAVAMENTPAAARPMAGGIMGDANNSEFQVLYSLVYSLSQRVEDHGNKMHDLFSAQNRYLQGMNTNIGTHQHLSQVLHMEMCLQRQWHQHQHQTSSGEDENNILSYSLVLSYFV